MTTTQAAKTPLRRTKLNAEELRDIISKYQDLVLFNTTRTTLKEGQDVVILSSDGIGFSGYVYGFERNLDGSLITYVTLDS